MKMLSMLIPKKTKKELSAGSSSVDAGSRNKYPYGLELVLDTREIATLGIEDLTHGEQVAISARGTVTATEVREQRDSVSRTIRIQIKKLGIQSRESFDQAFDEATEGK